MKAGGIPPPTRAAGFERVPVETVTPRSPRPPGRFPVSSLARRLSRVPGHC